MNTGSLEKQAIELLTQALDMPSTERIVWLEKRAEGNSALRERVLALLAADSDSHSHAHLRTGGAGIHTDEDVLPDRIGPYRILSLIGRGGMGDVYEAVRDADDFDHSVAIKVIRPGALSSALVDRFQRERQILASLVHPHIARLYDGGQTDDGAPYIVMECVDGLPMTDWANEHALNLNDRLWLFSDLCRAVRHAHQNLIVHRDITPSNVLVTEAGAVKLIDFGIAKPHEVDGDNTAAQASNSLGNLSFTPGFAAPERSRGVAANTLSDIYSLGKLIEALTENCTSDPDVIAIIQNASADEPDKRYPSIDALMEDLENLRTGHSVNARRGNTFYRFGKLLKRRKYAALTTFIVFTGLLAGLFTTSSLYYQAERAEAAATQRFDETRALTSFLLNDLTDNLEAVPGTLPAQQKVAETSSKYLDILARSAETAPEVRLEYAKGLIQLAETQTQTGGANLGNPENGLPLYRTSLALLETMASEPGAGTDVLAALADAEAGYGYASGYHKGNYAKAEKYLANAVNRYDLLVKQAPDDAGIALSRVRAHQILLYFQGDDTLNAIAAFDTIETDYTDILERFPDEKRALPNYVSFLRISANYALDEWDATSNAAVPIAQKERHAQALDRIERSLKLGHDLLAAEPVHPEHIYQIVWSQEIEALLHVIDLEWRVTFEETARNLSDIGRDKGERAVLNAVKNDVRFKEKYDLGARLIPKIDYTDSLLERLAPFDGETFTHVEAVYYNLKARAYLNAQLRLDLTASMDALDQSFALLSSLPATRQIKLERASTYIEKAYVLRWSSVLYGNSTAAEACKFLTEAENIFRDSDTLSENFDGYTDYREWGLDISRQLACQAP